MVTSFALTLPTFSSGATCHIKFVKSKIDVTVMANMEYGYVGEFNTELV